MGAIMNSDNLGYSSRYGVISHVLMALDENVVMDEDYSLIKNHSINSNEGFDKFCIFLFKPWFEEFPDDKKELFFKRVDEAIIDSDENIEKVFSGIEFVFDEKIKDKRIFLKNLRLYLSRSL